jgi:hypothetical protein
MNVQLTQVADNLAPWKVKSIVNLRDAAGVEVAFIGEGGLPVRFHTTEFDVGERGAKSAALAKFAAAAGFGDVEDIFDFLTGLPKSSAGILFSEGNRFDLGDFDGEFEY